MAKLRLEDDGHCFVCGKNNIQGLKLQFILDKENCLKTEFRFEKKHQGYKDIVHGGLVALILDEVMGNLCWKLGKNAIAAEIQVRFKQPALVGSSLYFKGWIEKEDKKILYLKALAQTKDGTIVAVASGKELKLRD